MAYTTINKSTDYQNTKLYDGTGNSNAITGVGLQPDLVMLKSRTQGSSGYNGNNFWFDAVRGVTKRLKTDGNNAEVTEAQGLTAFGSDGFTVGTDDIVNKNGDSFVSWNWKAGTTSGITTNGTTTITPTAYSFNTTSKFSILKYTGNDAAGAYVAHGLGTTPTMIIVKKISGTGGWYVYHHKMTTDYNMYLDTTDAEFGGAYVYSPDATNFRLRDHDTVNENGETYVAYCFAEKTGYSKFGKYKGTSSTDGAFIYTGFKPTFFMAKCIDNAESWYIFDNKRLGYNVENAQLYPDNDSAEATTDYADILSNGIKFRYNSVGLNGSSNNYIYMAVGQTLVGTNNIPVTAR